MSRIIVTTSGKREETNVTANLGMALARLGRQVVLVDADFGLRNLICCSENRHLHCCCFHWECREQALVKDKEPNLVLLPAQSTVGEPRTDGTAG